MSANYKVTYYSPEKSRKGKGVQVMNFNDRADAEEFAKRHQIYARPCEVEETAAKEPVKEDPPYSEWLEIVQLGHLDYERSQQGQPWVPTPESVARDEANREKARRELAEIRANESPDRRTKPGRYGY